MHYFTPTVIQQLTLIYEVFDIETDIEKSTITNR